MRLAYYAEMTCGKLFILRSQEPRMADETKYERWIAILDDIYARADELKRNPTATHSPPEPRFDFELIAFERLKAKIADSKITIREYYRLCGCFYSLRKYESRQLLNSLVMRFPMKTDHKHVWIGD